MPKLSFASPDTERQVTAGFAQTVVRQSKLRRVQIPSVEAVSSRQSGLMRKFELPGGLRFPFQRQQGTEPRR